MNEKEIPKELIFNLPYDFLTEQIEKFEKLGLDKKEIIRILKGFIRGRKKNH